VAKTKIIHWEHYKDPFGLDIPRADLLENENGIVVSDEEMVIMSKMARRAIPLINTHLGIIPYCEATSYSKRFDAYLGHANFSLDKNTIKLLDKIEGIEVVDVFSRYRLRMCVGKAFEVEEVKQAIHEALNNPVNEPSIFPQVVFANGFQED
jgi:hypothetical protein